MIMKFIKVITKHTVKQMETIVGKLEDSYVVELCELYNSFECIEFTTKEGFEAMYAVVDDSTIEKLFTEYLRCEINFSYEDITKFVLFGNSLEISGESKKDYLNYLTTSFIRENLNSDAVLDKISEKGISSLTEIDKKILALT